MARRNKVESHARLLMNLNPGSNTDFGQEAAETAVKWPPGPIPSSPSSHTEKLPP